MLKKLSKYVSQSVLGMIGVSVYILADTYFISRGFGSDGLAVLNLTLPIYGLIYAVGQMIGIGFSIIYSLAKAQGARSEALFMQGIRWCALFSIPFILIGIFSPDGLLRLFGADAALAQMGKNYIRLILCFSPVFMMNYIFTAFARNDNAPTLAMAGALAGSLYNIVFDYVFMFPLGLGYTGAAMATVGCPIVSMLICLLHFAGKENSVGFKMEKLSVSKLLKACSVGMSGFVGEFSSAVISAVFNFLMLNLVGNVGVAAYSVIANIALVCVCIFNGIAQGMQPLFSESYGHAHAKELRFLLRFGIGIVLTVAVFFQFLSFGFAAKLVSVFNTRGDLQLAAYAESGLRLYFLGFLGAGINIILIAYYSATGNARPVIIGSLLRGMIFISLFAILFARLFGVTGVWLSYIAAEAATLAVIAAMSHKKSLQSV